MKRRFGFALSLLLLITAFAQPIHAADKEPRKILSGWIPYYSVKTECLADNGVSEPATATIDVKVLCE